MMRYAWVLLAAVGLASALAAGAGDADALPQVTLLSVRVEKTPDPKLKEDLSLYDITGTAVGMIISDANHCMIGVDKAATKITAFTDDKNTDLLGGCDLSAFGLAFPKFSADGHHAALTLASTDTPVAGATRIKVVGTLVITCGVGPKTDLLKGVKLVKGTKLNLGSVPVTISDAAPATWGDAKLEVDLEAKESLKSIRSIRFLAPDGTEIKGTQASSSMTGMNGKLISETLNCYVNEKVAQADIEVTYWQSIDSVQIPLNIDTGVGF